MDIRSQISRNRSLRRKAQRSNPLGTAALVLAGLISLLSAGGVIYGVIRYSEITANLPAPEKLELLFHPQTGALLEPTRIYDQSGKTILWELENPAVEERRYLNITDGNTLFYRDVPEELIQATVTALDPEYLSRPEGFLPGILSDQPDPIPCLLVAELLLWDEPGHPYRDLRASLLANQLVARYGRYKVLEWFLNSAYFGNQIYGIEQAAGIYFGKPARELDLSESALLAGVISYPSLNPYDSPDAAKENQEALLQEMEAGGLISRSEENRALQEQLIYADPEGSRGLTAPAYVEYILKEADNYVPLNRLLRGGFTIISTLDRDLQGNLECTLQLMAERAYGGDPPLDPACPASRLLPKYPGTLLSGPSELEMNLILLDPVQGRVLALAGYSTSRGQTNILAARNPGTLITPFLYLNSFTLGLEPASLIWDIPPGGEYLTGEDLHPECGGDCAFQGPVSMRVAMVNDYLAPANQLWQEQGSSRLEETLALFGFSLEGEHCSSCEIFQGVPFLDLIEIAQGYGVFMNRGLLRGLPSGESGLGFRPGAIVELRELTGEDFFDEGHYQGKQVISEQLAYLVNQVLSDDAARGEADIFQIGRPSGVKYGHVPGSASAWAVGYTPHLLTAVWAGSSAEGVVPEPAGYGQIAPLLWRAITQYASRDRPASEWELPQGMVTLDVCYPSGMLPSDHCPLVVREIFIEGNEPQSQDSLYQARRVNRETGLLASVFTPAQLIEEKVYLDLPSQALEWAASQGIPTPPTLYDLEIPRRQPEGLRLSFPDNLSFVRGQVSLIGSIPEADFQSARLQYGEGMNPTSWLQIGDNLTSPGEDQILGAWDTSSLEDGVYALQLVVVKQDQQIAATSLLVSVDNAPPDIILKTDLGNGELSYEAGKEILFEAEFDNRSEISRVEFYLNGDSLSVRETSPYIALWRMERGSHTLLVRAFDLAGNQSELEVNFRIISG